MTIISKRKVRKTFTFMPVGDVTRNETQQLEESGIEEGQE